VLHAVAHPGHWLAYNFSPSFNWDAAGLGTDAMKHYVWDLAKLGFVWQFITVSRRIDSSSHCNTVPHVVFAARRIALEVLTSVTASARSFAAEGMKAYVELIQRKERDIGCDVLTHQKWSGADYADKLAQDHHRRYFVHRCHGSWMSRKLSSALSSKAMHFISRGRHW
jgi:isocitrate lyase